MKSVSEISPRIQSWPLKESGVEMKMRDKKYEHRVLIVSNGTFELGDKELFGHLKMGTITNF